MKNIQENIGTHWIENGRVKEDKKNLKEYKCAPCSSKVTNICCKQVKTTIIFKNQKQAKLERYFTIQIARQNILFILWIVKYATYNMSVKTRHHS